MQGIAYFWAFWAVSPWSYPAVGVQKGLAISWESVDQVTGEQLPAGAIATPATTLAQPVASSSYATPAV